MSEAVGFFYPATQAIAIQPINISTYVGNKCPLRPASTNTSAKTAVIEK